MRQPEDLSRSKQPRKSFSFLFLFQVKNNFSISPTKKEKYLYVGLLFQLCTGLKASLVQALRTIVTYYNKNRNSSNIYKEHFKLNMNMNDLTRERTNNGHVTEDTQAASSIRKYAQHPMSLRNRKFKQWHHLLEWLKHQNWPLMQTNAGQDTEQRGLPFIPGPAEWYNHFERTLSTLQSKESCSQKTQQ